jgi:hypothetical protein
MATPTNPEPEVEETEEDLFEKARGDLHEAVSRAMQISIATASRHVPQRDRWAYWLQGRVCIVGSTIDSISNKGEDDDGVFTLDHISIATLARTIIDICLMIHYVSERGIEDSEWNFRRAILRLHDTTARYRIFKSFHEREAGDFRKGIDEIRSEVSGHALFSTFDEAEQKQLLGGTVMFINGMRSVAKTIGWDPDKFDLAHTYLSSQVHNTPLSFTRMGEHDTNYESPSSQQYSLACFALSCATAAINHVSKRMIEIFPDLLETAPSLATGVANMQGSFFTPEASA